MDSTSTTLNKANTQERTQDSNTSIKKVNFYFDQIPIWIYQFQSSLTQVEIRAHLEIWLYICPCFRSHLIQQSLCLSDSSLILRNTRRKPRRNAALWPSICTCIYSRSLDMQVFDLYIHQVFDPLCQKYYITQERYTEPEARKKRCYTLVKWGYSIIYYIISSVWSYKILCSTRFMPTWLGGNGNPYILIEQGPKVLDATFQMKVYYICQFGKHFARFFGHIFIRPEGSYFEYALHHGLSVFLIVFSYLTNQWLIGIFVLFVHDYSDFGLILGRGYKDYRNMSKKILDFTYVHGFIAWIVCRLILFMAVCIYPAFKTCLLLSENHVGFTDFEYSVLKVTYWFMTFMMMGLYVLHIFWTYYLIESFISVKMPSKAVRHSYD